MYRPIGLAKTERKVEAPLSTSHARLNGGPRSFSDGTPDGAIMAVHTKFLLNYMATIPIFEELILEVHHGFGLKFDQKKQEQAAQAGKTVR